MLVLQTHAAIATVPDPALRNLIDERFAMLSEDEPYDPTVHGFFIVLQEGDTLAALTKEMGFSVFENRFTGARFGDENFTPCAEVIEELLHWFDLVYVIGDSGYGINLFVPKASGIPHELLEMCSRYAVPAPEVGHT